MLVLIVRIGFSESLVSTRRVIVKLSRVSSYWTGTLTHKIVISKVSYRQMRMLFESGIRAGMFVAILLAIATIAFGQGITTGTISGTIEDQQGAVIPGAKITVVNTTTNVTSTNVTGQSGAYALRNLPVGVYNVTIESAGFAPMMLSGVVVTAGNESSLGVHQLALGSTQVVVNVDSAAPVIEATTS